MTHRWAVRVLLLMVMIFSLGLASATTASAKKKNSVIATLNGKRFKWKGRFVLASYSGNGTIIVAAKPGKVIRTIGFGCPIYPPNETFPLSPPAQYCNANYTETTGRRHPIIKGWLKLSDVQVTYESFDGDRLTGSFSATLDPVPGNDLPPVTVAGTFNTKATPR